jgi:hypothetical protein
VASIPLKAGGTPRGAMSTERYRHRGATATNGRSKEPKQLKLL